MDRIEDPAPGQIQQAASQSPLGGLPGTGVVIEAICLVPGSGCTASSRKRYYFTQDEQMNVHAVTDAEGKLVEGYVYEPYGGVTVVKPGASGEVTWTSSIFFGIYLGTAGAAPW